MKALGHMVSEKKIFSYVFFSNCKSKGAIDPPPPGWAISDPRGRLGRINVKLITMLHAKYRNFGCCGFREEGFFMYFPL